MGVAYFGKGMAEEEHNSIESSSSDTRKLEQTTKPEGEGRGEGGKEGRGRGEGGDKK